MGALENALIVDPNLVALLEPGESVVTLLVQAALAPSGDERIIAPPSTTSSTEAGERLGPLGSLAGVAAAVGAAALSPTGWSGDGLPLTVLGGVRVAGVEGSQGVRLYRAVEARSGPLVLVVTDRRIVLLERGRSAAGRAFSLVAASPRRDLVAARRRGRFGARGRVELYFTDGSMIALMTGAISTRPARRLLDALAVLS